MSFQAETPIIKLNATTTQTLNNTTQAQYQQEENSIFDNFKAGFTSWINDEDKVCTEEFVDENNDGLNDNDDGKLSWKEKAESFGKGLLGIVKTAVKHPIATGLTLGAGILATALTGGAAAPLLCAAGAAFGAGTIAYGGYKAATAKTDAEAKQAWETMGNGTFALGVSVLSAGSSLKAAGKGGVASAHGAATNNPFKNIISCFKIVPQALKTSLVNGFNNVVNIFNPGMVTINGKNTLVNGEEVQAATDGIKIMTQNFENTSPWPETAVRTAPNTHVTTALKGSSLNDTTTSELVNFLSQFDDIRVEDWGTFGRLGDMKLGSWSNNAKITNAVSSTEAIAHIFGNTSAGTQISSGILTTEITDLINQEEE